MSSENSVTFNVREMNCGSCVGRVEKALLAVSGLAVIVGRLLLQRVKLSVLHYVGATVCVLMAGLTVWEMTQ